MNGPRLGERHFAQLPAADKFDRRTEVCTTALLQTDLHDAASFRGDLHKPLALADRVSGRRFDVDIFPCLTRERRHRNMPMVGCGDTDSVDGRVVQQSSKIMLAARSL